MSKIFGMAWILKEQEDSVGPPVGEQTDIINLNIMLSMTPKSN